MQSYKLDVQIDLMNIMASHIAGIHTKLENLTTLIKRVQAVYEPSPKECACSPIVDKLSTILEVLNAMLTELTNQKRENMKEVTESVSIPSGSSFTTCAVAGLSNKGAHIKWSVN